jgi:hypothetical protein
LCFFFDSLQRLNKGFSGLFGIRDEDDADGSEDDFTGRFGWIYNAKMVADFENISLDQAYELGVIQFLNDLSYLKEKDAHDQRLIKNATKPE